MRNDEIYPTIKFFINDSSNLKKLNSLVKGFESDTLELNFYRTAVISNFNKKNDSIKLNDDFLMIRNNILEINKFDIEIIKVESKNVYFTGYNGECKYTLIQTTNINELKQHQYKDFKFYEVYNKDLIEENSKLLFRMNDSLYLAIKKGYK